MCVKWELLLPVLSFFCVCAWSALVLPQVGRPFEPFWADDARRWPGAQEQMGMTPEQITTPHIRRCALLGISLRAREGTPAAAGPVHGWDDAASMPGMNAVGKQRTMMIAGPQPFDGLSTARIVPRSACRHFAALAAMKH